MTEEKKKGNLGKGCLIVVGVIVGLGIIGAIAGGEDSGGDAGNTAGKAAALPPVEVTALQLEKAYADNEAAAQQTYGGRPVLISGTVLKIELDFADKPTVMLAGDNPYMGPRLDLTEDTQALAANMTKGQQLTFLCSGVGEVIGMPMLKDCSIADPARK